MSNQNTDQPTQEALDAWHIVHHVLLNTRLDDLPAEKELPDLVEFCFRAFNEHYHEYIERNNTGHILPRYLLARPLIGFEDNSWLPSPLFSEHTDLMHLSRQVHYFRQYVGLTSVLTRATSAAGAMAPLTLQKPDSGHFCHHFHRHESAIHLVNPSGIDVIAVPHRNSPEVLAFADFVQQSRIKWPSPQALASWADLSDTTRDYENEYMKVCQTLELQDTLVRLGPRLPDTLFAWWLHQANADLIMFRGRNNQTTIYPGYDWGGVWFLIEEKATDDHLRAMSLLVHECFMLAVMHIKARDEVRAQEWRRDARQFKAIKDYMTELTDAVVKAGRAAYQINSQLNTTGSGFLGLYPMPAIADLFADEKRITVPGENEGTEKTIKSAHAERKMDVSKWLDYQRQLKKTAPDDQFIQYFTAMKVTPGAGDLARRLFRLLKYMLYRPYANAEIWAIQLVGACWAMRATEKDIKITMRERGGELIAEVTTFVEIVDCRWNEAGNDRYRCSRLPDSIQPVTVLDAFIKLIDALLTPDPQDTLSLDRVIISVEELWIEARIECKGRFKSLDVVFPDRPDTTHNVRASVKILLEAVGEQQPSKISVADLSIMDHTIGGFVVAEEVSKNSELTDDSDSERTVFRLRFPRDRR